LEHDGFDHARYKIVWEQQENGDWDKIFYMRSHNRHTKDYTSFVVDRYLESNVSNKEYFIRKLNGTLDDT
jgi:hypothetical protein